MITISGMVSSLTAPVTLVNYRDRTKDYIIHPGVETRLRIPKGIYRLEVLDPLFMPRILLLEKDADIEELLFSTPGGGGSGVIALGASDPVPPGTPPGTVIVRA